MDARIHHRLQSIENDFLLSIRQSHTQRKASYTHWVTLQQDLEVAATRHALQHNTIALAKAVAARVTIVAEEFLKVYSQSETLTREFFGAVDGTLTQHGLAAPREPSSSHSAANTTVDVSSMSSVHPNQPTTPTSDETEEDTTPPPPIAGIKRRFSTSSPATPNENVQDEPSARPCKRSRYVRASNLENTPIVIIIAPHSIVPPTVNLPIVMPQSTPPALPSAAVAQPISTVPKATSSSPNLVTEIAPSSRKRRLSDASLEHEPKRPRLLPNTPPSTHISLTSELSSFVNFYSPPSLSTNALDISGPFDNSLFDWNAFADAHAEPTISQNPPREHPVPYVYLPR